MRIQDIHNSVIIAAVLLACAALVAAQSQHVTNNPGAVQQTGTAQGEEVQEVNAASVHVTDTTTTILSPVFKPPVKPNGDERFWFKDFDPGHALIPWRFVDIVGTFDPNQVVGVMIRPNGTLWESKSDIRVYGVFAAQHAGAFPLHAEGNLTPVPGNGGNGPGDGTQFYWAAKVSKSMPAHVRLKVIPSYILRGDTGAGGSYKVHTINDDGEVVEEVDLKISLFQESSENPVAAHPFWPRQGQSTINVNNLNLPTPAASSTWWKIVAEHDNNPAEYAKAEFTIPIVEGYWRERAQAEYRGFSSASPPWLVIPLGHESVVQVGEENIAVTELILDGPVVAEENEIDIVIADPQIAGLTSPDPAKTDQTITPTIFKGEAVGETHAVAVIDPQAAQETLPRINISIKPVLIRNVRHVFVRVMDGDNIVRNGTPQDIGEVHSLANALWLHQSAVRLNIGSDTLNLSTDPGVKPTLQQAQAVANAYINANGQDQAHHFVFWWWDLDIPGDGWAAQGGNVSHIKSQATGTTLAHELGHNLGLRHQMEEDALMRGGPAGTHSSRIYKWEVDVVNK